MSKLVNAWDNQNAYTANGAVTNKSSLNPVLDLFSTAGAMRSKQDQVNTLFANAYSYDKILALKAAFYLRDVRQGQGERVSFRTMLKFVYDNDIDAFVRIVPLVAEYGRWDDITEYVLNPVVVRLVRNQLNEDKKAEYPSLLAKWMPSENASSEKTKYLARTWITALRMDVSSYRKMLSAIRAKINIVEAQMSSGNWSEIDYARVPSKAMAQYRSAFGKRDTDRFGKYLSSVEKGEVKINSSVMYPYEFFIKMLDSSSYLSRFRYDRVLEAQWNALPNYMVDGKSALVMADVSGSMSGQPIAVSVSLALYAAERAKGPFNGYFLTFSGRPELVKVVGKNLAEKFNNINQANWDQNTDVQAAFDKILDVAKKNRLDQSDMPDIIFVISDMEFDSAGLHRTNFDVIDAKFKAAGYTRPTLVFWNVNGRIGNSPVTEKENGVYLVSGFSPTVFKSALTVKSTTPVEMMLEVLNSDRYAAIETALS